MVSLQTFYDQHPINESEILEKVEKEGIARADIKPEDLSRYDQDHYGALASTDALVDALGIGPDTRVLDLCSGMGGTSRYLAYRYGATVLGVDLTESRVNGARRLTELVGLQDKVSFRVGDAAHLDLDGDSVDRIVSQESFLHIEDREGLFAGCFRVLESGGGIGFTDLLATDRIDDAARARFVDGFVAPHLASADAYVTLMRGAGLSDVKAVDLSAEWLHILHDRLEMYRSLEAETVARFGRERFEKFVDTYEFFIGQIDAGAVGGARFTGWKP